MTLHIPDDQTPHRTCAAYLHKLKNREEHKLQLERESETGKKNCRSAAVADQTIQSGTQIQSFAANWHGN